MKEQKFSEALKVTKTIHWSITLMPVLFSIVVLSMILKGHDPESPELKDTFLIISIVILLIAIPLSTFIFKKHIKQNVKNKSSSATNILSTYQTAHLIRLSILEIAGLFAVIGSFMTGYIPILGIGVLSTLAMALITPTTFRIYETFGLNMNDLD